MAGFIGKERSSYEQKPEMSGDERIVINGTQFITPTQIAAPAMAAAQAEATRARQVEQTLARAIDAESERAQQAEGELSLNLTQETQRATQSEGVLANAIESEETRATGAESGLADDISEESERAQNAEAANASAINAEAERAQGAESNLSNAIDAEETRAKAKESELGTAINTESQRAQGAEGNLSTAIATETGRATGKETELATAISQEVTRASQAESNLSDSLKEVSDATNKVVSVGVAFGENGSTVTCTISKINIKTGVTSTESVAIPVADANSAGVMNPQTYQAIQNNQTLINAILGASVAVTGLDAVPTQAQITSAWQTATGLTDLINGARVFDVTNQKVWTYYTNDATWYAVAASGGGTVVINAWTNNALGTVKGVADNAGHTNDGKLTAEADGTGSVLGWDRLNSKVDNKQDVITDLDDIREGSAAGATAVQDADYVHTDNNYSDTEKSKVASAVQPAAIANFITKSVDDLLNYYLKSETYTKAEVQALIDAVKQFSYEAVTSLPTASASTMHKIYLVPSSDPQSQNIKDEYITIDNGASAETRYTWEQIGSTAIDLSNYHTISEETAAINAALNPYRTSANQDTIDDAIKGRLDTIEDKESGWDAKYNKPSSGIPKSDLAEGVKESLEKADSALQQHQSLAEYRKASQQDVIDSEKVDKVPGKGLSTNDYTTAEKQKLAGIAEGATKTQDNHLLQNGTVLINGNSVVIYDDAEIRQSIAGFEKGYVIASESAITGTKDTTTGNWNNVTAITGIDLSALKIGDNVYLLDDSQPDFWVSQVSPSVTLNVLDTKTDLSNYFNKAEITALLAQKQETLVSGQNIKTVNNQSLLGEGNIEIQGGGVEEAPEDDLRYVRLNKTWVSIDTAYTDLSMIGVDGVPLTARTTANCYVVKEAGDYIIPLLYGAAVKNGVENPAAYTNEGGALQTDFVNTYGEVIRSSSIETDQHQAVSAEVCLSDSGNAVTDLLVVNRSGGRYIGFHVPAIPTQGANVLISVLDANGHVMWTFHIWLWSRSLAPITFVNHTGIEYPLMPVNLGSKLDADLVHIKNWLYQHGRVNPMPCPAAYNSNSNHALFGAKSYGTQAAGSIADALAAPQNFVLQDGEEFYNWFVGGTKYNLWDAHCSAAGASDNNVVKTVYDPCPVGWKVPAGRAFTGFTATGGYTEDRNQFNVVGDFDAGWKFKKNAADAVGQLFPASGYRYRPSGGLNNVGGYGYYWSAAAYSRAYAYGLDFYSGYVYPLNYNYRALGFSVRPSLDI